MYPSSSQVPGDGDETHPEGEQCHRDEADPPACGSLHLLVNVSEARQQLVEG